MMMASDAGTAIKRMFVADVVNLGKTQVDAGMVRPADERRSSGNAIAAFGLESLGAAG